VRHTGPRRPVRRGPRPLTYPVRGKWARHHDAAAEGGIRWPVIRPRSRPGFRRSGPTWASSVT